MSAIPYPKLWTPQGREDRLAGPRRFRDWLRAPVHGMGRLFSSSGWVFSSSGGDFGSTSGPCCLYQARRCSDGTLAGVYVKKSQFPSWPSTYYFSYSGSCYYVQSTDTAACNSTPVVSGQTTVASCADAACGGKYYTRYCDTGELTGLCMAAPTSPFTSRYYFTDTTLWVCKYVDPADAVPTGTSCTPENAHSTNVSCSDLYCSCPTSGCSYFPSSVTCTGWNNTIGNCGYSFPFTTTSCYYDSAHTTLLPTWNGILVIYGVDCKTFVMQSNAYSNNWAFTLADGTCGTMNSMTLACQPLYFPSISAYRKGWILDYVIQGGAGVSGGCGPATLRYFKRGFYPQGTYDLVTGLSGYGPCPCPDVPFTPASTLSIS